MAVCLLDEEVRGRGRGKGDWVTTRMQHKCRTYAIQLPWRRRLWAKACFDSQLIARLSPLRATYETFNARPFMQRLSKRGLPQD